MEKARGSGHEQIAGIDMLRFFCALLVVVYHLGFWTFSVPFIDIGSGQLMFGPLVHARPILPFAPFGGIGVPIFFVISGFVIAYSANGSSLSRYVKGRIVRLAPAAWICATITLAVTALSGIWGVKAMGVAYVQSLLFLPIGPWIDSVFWTLPIELSFYALISLFLMANSMKRAEPFFTLVGLVSTGLWLTQYSTHHLQPLYASLHIDPTHFGAVLDKFLHRRFGQLSLAAFGFCFASGFTIWSASRRGYTPLRVASLAIMSIGALAYLDDYAARFQAGPLALAPLAAIYLGGVIFLIVSIRFNQYFPRRFVREMGLATYPLYLLHNVVGSYLMGRVFMRYMPLAQASWLAIVCCLLLVFVVVRPLERRLQGLFRRVLSSFSLHFRAAGGMALSPFTRATVPVE